MVRKITTDLEAAKARTLELRKRRDDAAATLREAGYSSAELAEKTTVQASRVRHYVTAGEVSSEYTTVQDFVDAYEAWEYEDARASRLRAERDQLIIEALDSGKVQNEVAAEFGVSQFLVSYTHRHRGEVTLL